jgi:hypothetical protein
VVVVSVVMVFVVVMGVVCVVVTMQVVIAPAGSLSRRLGGAAQGRGQHDHGKDELVRAFCRNPDCSCPNRACSIRQR